jgi:hypothetical protein
LDELRLFHSFQSGAPLYLYVKRAYISNRVIIDMLMCALLPTLIRRDDIALIGNSNIVIVPSTFSPVYQTRHIVLIM